MDPISFIVSLLASGIRLGSVLGLASIGETFSQRSGILGIGLEGYMTLGTITGFAVSFYSGSAWIGIIAAMAIGLLVSALHGWLSINMGVHQMVSGIGIVFFGAGLMSIMDARIFESLPIFPKVDLLNPIAIPGLSSIPGIGPIFFNHSPLIYVLYALIPAAWYVLFRTKLGLRLRAAGEFSGGADTMGVDVYRMRYFGALFSGVMGGLAGGFLSLGVARSFQGGMVAGRGFIVIAAIVLGNWNPIRVVGACILFGIIDAFQYKMQILNWWSMPNAFWLMLPYLVTIVALVATRNVRVPRELTIPYIRGRRTE